MLNWLNLGALALLTGSLWMEIAYRRGAKGYRVLRFERAVRLALAVAGLGVMGMTAWWQHDPETRVLGFPFTSAVFELHDGIWYDHVGAVTLPALVANVVFWPLVLQAPVTMVAFHALRRQASPNERVVPTS